MQMVILAGGLGTRLSPLTDRYPKSMVILCGKPFIEHQIELLKASGINEILLCIGHMGEQIVDYCKNGEQFGVQIKYSSEGEILLGTAGALKKAYDLLDDHFFVMYGDSYLLLDYQAISNYFIRSGKESLMVVYKNYDLYESSNTVVQNNLVTGYDKKRRLPGMIFIDEGLLAFRKTVLDIIKENCFTPLEETIMALIEKNEMAAYETVQRFYTIGNFEELKECEELIQGMEANK